MLLHRPHRVLLLLDGGKENSENEVVFAGEGYLVILSHGALYQAV